MVANQTYSNRGLSSFLLLVEKCKPCEIYKRMCFSQKVVYKLAKHVSIRILSEKKKKQNNELESTDFLRKKNVPDAALSKEGYADCLIDPSLLISLKRRQL